MGKDLILLPKTKKNLKITKASLELFKINAEYKLYEEKYKQRKKELQDIIKSSGVNEFAINNGDNNLKVNFIESTRINWDVEKLKSKLPKKIFNKIVKKEYKINDFSGLVEYLKKYGVNPKGFSKFINVECKVDNKKVDELGEIGEVNIEDLKDCYSLDKISEYVKFSEIKEMDD